jgi:hypothetical protein
VFVVVFAPDAPAVSEAEPVGLCPAALALLVGTA